LAPEGINGSICGTREAVEAVMSVIQGDERLAGLQRTEAPAELKDEEIHHGHSSKSPLGAGENAPFRWDHVRVKLKKEVCSSSFLAWSLLLNTEDLDGEFCWLVFFFFSGDNSELCPACLECCIAVFYALLL
jgi:hypothetical protein